MKPEEQMEVFESLKKLMVPYAKKFTARTGCVRNKADYGLVSEKEVEVLGRKRKEMWFAGLINQKGYVGFYYMPVYARPDMKKVFKPELLKLLKGKCCFHVRKLTPEVRTQVKDALKVGYEMYRKNGWV
ncbi:MAG: DUF1801 domain-containing protein [Acidobacteriales bacterium]|nr:DUF1801 domain-containing protein [Terriglobales bacterium]